MTRKVSRRRDWGAVYYIVIMHPLRKFRTQYKWAARWNDVEARSGNRTNAEGIISLLFARGSLRPVSSVPSCGKYKRTLVLVRWLINILDEGRIFMKKLSEIRSQIARPTLFGKSMSYSPSCPIVRLQISL